MAGARHDGASGTAGGAPWWRRPAPPAGAAAAVHGGAAFALDPSLERLERYREAVDADVLDAWYPPSPRVASRLAAHLEWLVKTSPPVHAEGLVATIAAVRGLRPERLLAGGGSSDLIYLALPRLLDRGGRTVVLDPTYGEYAHVVERVIDARLERHLLAAAEGFRVDVERLAATARGADLVVLVNPNNPTGRALGRDEVLDLCERLGGETLLLVDETYVDFTDPTASVERWAGEIEGLAVLKSMSKHYALSGLRVAYLAAAEAMVRELARWSPPWAVSLPAQVAAIAALEDEGYYRRMVRETHRLRAELATALAAVPGLVPHDGVGNFVLVELGASAPGAAAVRAGLARLGIHVRDCDSQGTRLAGRFVRVAVKDAGGNARIVEGFRAVLAAAG